MNRYVGNSGVVERIPEPEPGIAASVSFPSPPPQAAGAGADKKPSGRSLLGGGLGGLLSKLGKAKPETEDLMLAALMYLLYRESGDIEFLLIGGALLLL